MDSLAHVSAVIDLVFENRTPDEELAILATTSGPYQAVAKRIFERFKELQAELIKLKSELAFTQDALAETREGLR